MRGLYKYVYNGEIVYIGKSNESISKRIKNHSREEKFRQYLDSDIYIFQLDNKDEIDLYEKILIGKYKPILNVQGVDNNFSYISIHDDLVWEPFECKKKRIEYKKKYPRKNAIPSDYKCIFCKIDVCIFYDSDFKYIQTTKNFYDEFKYTHKDVFIFGSMYLFEGQPIYYNGYVIGFNDMEDVEHNGYYVDAFLLMSAIEKKRYLENKLFNFNKLSEKEKVYYEIDNCWKRTLDEFQGR